MIPVICLHCHKTISVDKRPNLSCPECGGFVNLLMMQRHGLIIDKAKEESELNIATDYFKNAEFMSASEHFRKALKANKNSYIAQYFISVCDIYLNNSSSMNVVEMAINAVTSALKLMERAGATPADRQSFVTAMLSEIKIIIINRLNSHDELYEYDINKYREAVIADLKKAIELFRIDSENIMSYLPPVSAALVTIADSAIALCHKAVQTLAIGAELCSPSDTEQAALTTLRNEFYAFAQTLDGGYSAKKYAPDFSQCCLLNENVADRLQKFDTANKPYAKKHIIGNTEEYNSIIKDCEKAVEFIYRVCFTSMCDTDSAERNALLEVGLSFTERLLTPRIVASDKKRAEIDIGEKIVMENLCGVFSKFLHALDDAGNSVVATAVLHRLYETLYDAAETYFTPVYDKFNKRFNKIKENYDDEYAYCERFLFASAIITAPALSAYIDYDYKCKNRSRLVKLCKNASDAFMMLNDYNVERLENSQSYSTILDICKAVMQETDK